MPDPCTRLSEAHGLGAALVMARLSLTKARVQQIADAPRNLGLAAACAFCDDDGGWHGELWVPETSSMSHDQAIFVDCATGAGLSPYAVLLKISRFGSGLSGAAASSAR